MHGTQTGAQPPRQRIAIVGAGISGLGAAIALKDHHDITLFEKRPRLGGHSATVDIEHGGKQIAVDTGFIVYNNKNYPNLIALFEHLNVATEKSNMSFAVSLDGGRFEWGNPSLAAVFAQPLNMITPSFLWMFREIMRFNKQALIDRDAGLLDSLTLGDYIKLRSYSAAFTDNYLLPMCGSVWSTPCDALLDFPARPFVDFLDNHNMVRPRQVPEWRTVTGGSRNYVNAIKAHLSDRIRTDDPVVAIDRDQDGVTVRTASGPDERFDQVVMATHSDQALDILTAPSRLEADCLAAVRYRPNDVYLHHDANLMPIRRATWAGWNYMSAPADKDPLARQRVFVSYWMNSLQNIDSQPIFVTLNPYEAPRGDKVFATFSYDHPQYDAAMFAARERLLARQGENRTWYCGAWTGYGFHEDGLRSGLTVARALGGAAPWDRTSALAIEPANRTLEAAE